MNGRALANVDTTPIDPGIQPSDRSMLISDRAAASPQPITSVFGAASESPSGAFLARHQTGR
jgi:hypothetical protein